jgi:hypothetical protein
MRRATESKVAVWALVASLLVARDGTAQCGAKRSSCSGCHDGARAALPSHDPWHENHAFADLCPICHGGRGDANDPVQAHVGLTMPLGNADQCGACHGTNTQTFVERYRMELRKDADAGTAAATTKSDSSTPPPSPPRATHAHGESGSNLAMTAIVTAIGAFAVFFVVQRERARSRRAAHPAVGSASPV